MCNINKMVLVLKSEPNPFNGMDLAKHCTFLIQLWPSFNDQKKPTSVLYLKGNAPTRFENSLTEPALINLPAWSDDYEEFVSELKTYFGSMDLIGKAESKLKSETYSVHCQVSCQV